MLSGFVNPERGILRSQAMEMGAEYQPDWNSRSTLLVCAFPNTPKFRQVQTDCGTIVSKVYFIHPTFVCLFVCLFCFVLFMLYIRYCPQCKINCLLSDLS